MILVLWLRFEGLKYLAWYGLQPPSTDGQHWNFWVWIGQNFSIFFGVARWVSTENGWIVDDWKAFSESTWGCGWGRKNPGKNQGGVSSICCAWKFLFFESCGSKSIKKNEKKKQQNILI